MKRISIVASLILIIFSIVKIVVKPPSATQDISGTYILRNKSDGETGAIMAVMQISMKAPSSIEVKGVDQTWSGSGSFSNDSGFYDWQFPSGDKGRTNLTLGKEGQLHGQVRGSNNSINWDYVATPKAAN